MIGALIIRFYLKIGILLMNNDINAKAPQTKNPWSVKENLPTVSAPFILWTVLYTLACSLYPFLESEYPKHAPYLMCAFGVVSVFLFYRLIAGRLLFIIPVALLAFSFDSFDIAAYVISLVVPVALGSVALAVCAKKNARLLLAFALLPAASFSIAYLLCESISISIISLSIYPAIILLAFALANDSGRVSAICHASIGFAIAAVGIVGVIVFRKYGEFSPDTLKVAITDLQKLCIRATHELFTVNEELLRPIYEAAQIESYKEIVNVEELIPTLFGYIPACAIILCNVLGFFSQSGALNTLDSLYKNEKNKLRTLRSSKFVMSATAAVVFLVAGTVQLIASCSGALTASLVSETVFLALLPGFCLSGFGTFIAKIMLSKNKHKVLILILALICASCMLYPALTVLAISGAFDTISYHLFLKKMSRPKGK